MANIEKAYFAAGCFWGVEDTYMKTPGVVETMVGYMGGHIPDPNYAMVCGGGTGYAETVEATFDPAKVKYEDLLKVFWENHDPTTLNRQGLDVGEQYRSAIFYANEQQKQLAEKSKADMASQSPKNVVTVIEPATIFYKAEDSHQKYYQKTGMA